MASNTEKSITAKFVLDSTGFNNSIKGVNAELKNSQSALKLASTGLNNYSKDSIKAKQVQTELARQVELHAKKIDVYKSAMEKASAKMQENISARDKIKSSLDQANKAYDEAVKMYGKESAEAQKAKLEVEKLSQEYNKNEKAIENNAKSIQNYDTQINKASTEMAKAQNELNKVNSELEKSNDKWNRASTSLKESSDKLTSIGEKTSSVGDGILKMTAPLTLAGGAALKVGMDFESGMSQVSAISGATGQELEDLKAKAQEMGSTTKFSASQASEAMQYMGMAGWKSGQMIDGISGIMNLAAASGEELASVSDIVTDALTAFGMSAEQSGHFADILASASSNANTNVSMLGESFKYVAPLCGSLNYSAEDAAVALGLMANAGIKGSQAGTSLKTALVNMVNPTDSMSAVMSDLGIEITKEDGTMKSLHETLNILREKFKVFSNEEIDANFKKYSSTLGMTRKQLESLSAEEQSAAIARGVGKQELEKLTLAEKTRMLNTMLSEKEIKNMTQAQKDYFLECNLGQKALYGLTQEEQSAAAATLFGKESLAGMLSIINASEADYNKLTNAINNCDGVAQNMADTMNDNLEGQFTLFKSQLEGVGIQLSQTLIPIARDMLTTISGWIDAFSKLSPETQANIVKLTAFSVAAGGVLKVVGSGISTIGKLSGGLSSTANVIGKVSKAVGDSGGIVSTASGLFSKFSGVAKGTATSVGVMGSSAGTAATAVEGAGVAASGAGLSLSALGSVLLPIGAAVAVVAGGIYTYKEAQEAMNESCDKSREELGFFKTALLELQGVEVKSQEELEKSGVKFKEFGDNIGDEFKGKVEDSTKSLMDFSVNLREINMDDTLTKEECDGVVSRVDEMVNSAIQAIDNKKEQSKASLTELFTMDDGTLNQSEQQVLDYLERTSKEQKDEANTLKAEIQAINQQALDEKRVLNEQEIQSIEEKTQRIKQIELENSSSTNEELLYAKNEFLARVSTMDLNSASELMQEKAKQRDEEIVKIKASYDTQIQLLQEKSMQATGVDKEAIDTQILNLKDARQQKIDLQNSTYQEYLNIIGEKNPEILNMIDQGNGEILTNEGVKCQERLQQMTDMYSGLDKITQDGYYSVMNTTTGSMENIYAKVDESTGKIVGIWSSTSGKVAGSNADIANSTKSTGQSVAADSSKMVADLNMLANGSVTSSGQMVNSMGQVVGSLNNVKTNADGTKSGIIDLNGTPIEVQTNADGVIQKCRDLTSNIESVPTQHKTVFSFIADGWESLKNKIASLGGGISQNWTGNESFKGGLTTLHERGYELYDLPQGTRIYNHESSEEMVMKTAESVAEKVANRIANNFQQPQQQSQPSEIIVPVIIDGVEFARVTAPYMSQEMQFNAGRGI